MGITELTTLVRGAGGRPRVIFDRIFDVSGYAGELVLPAGIRPWVAQRFGDPARVEKQQIVKVVNKVTLEGTLFNALRSLRPLASGAPEEVDRLVEENKAGCAFCRPGDKTPADTFGRLRNGGAVTASNVAKCDRWHGLIIPEEHHPLHFDAGQVAEYFALAARWFLKVMEQPSEMEGRTLYPFLVWNCLWPAGSSVVHGHLQVTVTPGGHYPRVEHQRRAAQAYRERYGAGYFDDLFIAHRAAGLALKTKSARVFASLTPIKEKESWVVLPGKAGLEHLEELGLWVGRVLACLRENGTTSFNVAAYIPPPRPAPEDWNDFPLIARVVDRGPATGRTADFGGMELYAASVVSTDPYKVARELRAHLAEWLDD